jgi:hypothetical protein
MLLVWHFGAQLQAELSDGDVLAGQLAGPHEQGQQLPSVAAPKGRKSKQRGQAELREFSFMI